MYGCVALHYRLLDVQGERTLLDVRYLPALRASCGLCMNQTANLWTMLSQNQTLYRHAQENPSEPTSSLVFPLTRLTLLLQLNVKVKPFGISVGFCVSIAKHRKWRCCVHFYSMITSSLSRLETFPSAHHISGVTNDRKARQYTTPPPGGYRDLPHNACRFHPDTARVMCTIHDVPSEIHRLASY